jgi:hypothetical protein
VEVEQLITGWAERNESFGSESNYLEVRALNIADYLPGTAYLIM